jgi:hypothetical protein
MSLKLATAPAAEGLPINETLVKHALRWFNVWVSPLPLQPGSVLKCKGKQAPDYVFVYCDPGHVTVGRHLAGEAGMGTRVLTALTYEENVRNRTFNGLGDWPKSTRQVAFTINSEEVLAQPSKDAELTKQFYERTRGVMLRPGPLSGAMVLFPWVSRGDPQYHVYIVRKGKVNSIWEYTVINHSVTDYANFVYYRPLVVAQRNLRDPSLWYRIETKGAAAAREKR